MIHLTAEEEIWLNNILATLRNRIPSTIPAIPLEPRDYRLMTQIFEKVMRERDKVW